MVLNAFTTLAPGARSATISLDVRPLMSPSINGCALATRLVVSIKIRPFQSPDRKQCRLHVPPFGSKHYEVLFRGLFRHSSGRARAELRYDFGEGLGPARVAEHYLVTY